MNIESNILKYYLRNVYFITGTAYAGKSTMVKMLSEKYEIADRRTEGELADLWSERVAAYYERKKLSK